MKSIVCLFILFSASLFAQEFSKSDLRRHRQKVSKSREKGTVEYSLDTIFKAGVPYCLFKTVNEDMEFSIQSFDQKEHVHVKMDCIPTTSDTSKRDCFWVFTFLGSGKSAELYYAKVSDLPEYIVENNLIVNNTVNPDGETKMLILFPQRKSTIAAPNSQMTVVMADADKYVLVERDRTAEVFFYGDRIQQDSIEIGYYTEDKWEEEGKIIVTLSFYLPSGLKVADVTFDQAAKANLVILTMKDYKTYHVDVNPDIQMQHICKFLIQRFYL
jgi:hypothetical protein